MAGPAAARRQLELKIGYTFRTPSLLPLSSCLQAAACATRGDTAQQPAASSLALQSNQEYHCWLTPARAYSSRAACGGQVLQFRGAAAAGRGSLRRAAFAACEGSPRPRRGWLGCYTGVCVDVHTCMLCVSAHTSTHTRRHEHTPTQTRTHTHAHLNNPSLKLKSMSVRLGSSRK